MSVTIQISEEMIAILIEGWTHLPEDMLEDIKAPEEWVEDDREPLTGWDALWLLSNIWQETQNWHQEKENLDS